MFIWVRASRQVSRSGNQITQGPLFGGTFPTGKSPARGALEDEASRFVGAVDEAAGVVPLLRGRLCVNEVVP
jgi:hypothetical protein